MTIPRLLLASAIAAAVAGCASTEPPVPASTLTGTATYREDIERGTDPRRMAESWKPAVAEFERLRQQYRLY